MPPQIELIRTSATVEVQAAAGKGKQPRVSILAYTGGVIDVFPYGTLVIDLAGLELPKQIPLLADHDSRLEGIIGHGEPTVAGGKLSIGGSLARTAPAERVAQLGRDGLEFRASVGVKPLEFRSVQKGDVLNINNQTITAERPLMLVAKGRLVEVSIVAVGADDNTAVSIAARGNNMTTPNPAGNGSETDPAVLVLERQRASGVMRAAADHPRIAAQAVTEGWDVQRTELEVLRASRPTFPPSGAQRGAPGGSPSQLLACAVLLHAGEHRTAEASYGAEFCARAADLRVTSSLDLCRASLMLEMRDVPVDRGEMVRAAFSTSSLSGALAASTERQAHEGFNELPSAWPKIAKSRPSPDFRQRQGLRPFLKGGELDKLGPDGEIKHASPDKETYPFQVHTWAKMFSIDRQTIINDDIGAIMELAKELGRQAARKLADEVAAVILANANDFFSAGNGNYISGADSALSIHGLGLAVQKLREQTDADGKAVDISPKVLLVPPALEAIGRQVLRSAGVLIDGNESAIEAPAANPWQDIAELAVDPRLASKAKEWYLFSDPANVPALVVSFLNGRQGPVVEQSDVDFNMLGRQFRVYIDFGVDQADQRGAVKSKGAA